MTSIGRALSLALLIGVTARGSADGGGEVSSSGADGNGAVSSTPLPQWRLDMAENTRINLGLNTQASVDPALDPARNPNYPNQAPWHAASGYAGSLVYTNFRYAPHLGEWGSVVGTVGGHNNYWGNQVLRFDLATRQFTPLSDPYTSLSHPGQFYTNADGMHSDGTNGEVHISASLTTDPTQPSPAHGYGHNVILPPDSAIGSGPHGAMLHLVRAARSPLGGRSTGRSHIFDFAQSNRATAAWQRYSTNLFTPTEAGKTFYMGWGVYDKTRKKVYAGIEHGPQNNKLKVLNCVTRQWETPITLSQAIFQDHSNAWHWEGNPNYIVNFISNYSSAYMTLDQYHLELIHIPTGTVYKPGTTGTGPSAPGGYEFVQNKIVVYEGANAGTNVNRVWILTPPDPSIETHFRATPWTWSFQDVTGPTPPRQTLDEAPHTGRFVWSDKVKSFLWWANGTDNVQAWRVKGFD